MIRSQAGLLDVQDVFEDLLVVAYREERIPRVGARAVAGRSSDDAGAAPREPLYLAPPLRLQRRRTHDEHLANAGFAREELGDADPLDGLAEPHLVRQDRAAGAGCERDSVELVGQQRLLEEGRTERMLAGRSPDLRHGLGDPRREQPSLDVLLGVGRNEERMPSRLQPLQPSHEVVDSDGAPRQRLDDRARLGRKTPRQRHGERGTLLVA